jgi:hypothetical protein
MKTVVAALLLATYSVAQANCWTIANADQRAYCRAVETKSRMQCTAIGDFGLRTRCYVQTGAGNTNCNNISDSWQRKQCIDQRPARR